MGDLVGGLGGTSLPGCFLCFVSCAVLLGAGLWYVPRGTKAFWVFGTSGLSAMVYCRLVSFGEVSDRKWVCWRVV